MSAALAVKKSEKHDFFARLALKSAFCAFVVYWHRQNFIRIGGTVDFRAFHTAGRILLAGAGDRLYNFDLQQQYQGALGLPLLPFYNPPVAALAYVPTAFFSLANGYTLWLVISMFFIAISAFVMHREIPVGSSGFIVWGSLLAFLPVQLQLFQGQIDVLLLPVFLLALRAFQRDEEWNAGMLLSMGLVKFQFLLPFIAILLLRRRWKALCGFAIGSVLFFVACLAITGGPELWHYVRLTTGVNSLSDVGIAPSMMANFRGLTYVIFQRDMPFISLALSVAAVIWSAFTWKTLDVGFARALTVSLLCSYHANPHSLMLLLIPLAIAIRSIKWASLSGVIVLALATPLLQVPTLRLQMFALMAIPIVLFAVVLSSSERAEFVLPSQEVSPAR